MVVWGKVGIQKSHLGRSAILSDRVGRQAGACPLVYRYTTAEVRQPKGLGAVAAVGSAEKSEECVVLRDGEQLPLALEPACGSEVESEVADFAEKRI